MHADDIEPTSWTGVVRDKWRAFRQWQQAPHQVAPLSDEEHVCSTCATAFRGNYCPRCGQSAKIGRYSFKKALLLFLDVWGLGNRGMFRTLRDLILRPGYMIRDYLSGMQMAYFPPFKLFFLLTTLSLVVESGFNLDRTNYFELSRQEIQQGFNDSFEESVQAVTTEEQRQLNTSFQQTGLRVMDYAQRFPNVSALSVLFVLSGFLYLFFRRSPNIPDLRFSELLVALVYTADMFSIYSIVMEFFCVSLHVQYATVLLPLLPLKQMSGFSWWRLLVIVLLIAVMIVVLFMLLGVAFTVLKFVLQ